MKVRNLKIGGDCYLLETIYDEGLKKEIALDYVEYDSGIYGDDKIISIDIDETKAMEIIQFLREAFEIEVY